MKSFTPLVLAIAGASAYNAWEDVTVTVTHTNTKTVCPCDSTSSWGSWVQSSSSMSSWSNWEEYSSTTDAYNSWAPVTVTYTVAPTGLTTSSSSTADVSATGLTTSSSSTSTQDVNPTSLTTSSTSTSTQDVNPTSLTTISSSLSSIVATTTTISSTSSSSTTTPAAAGPTYVIYASDSQVVTTGTSLANDLTGAANFETFPNFNNANGRYAIEPTTNFLVDSITGYYANVDNVDNTAAGPGYSNIFFNSINDIVANGLQFCTAAVNNNLLALNCNGFTQTATGCATCQLLIGNAPLPAQFFPVSLVAAIPANQRRSL